PRLPVTPPRRHRTPGPGCSSAWLRIVMRRRSRPAQDCGRVGRCVTYPHWHVCGRGGALSKSEYLDGLAAAGFDDAAVEFTHKAAPGVHFALIRAVKPAA